MGGHNLNFIPTYVLFSLFFLFLGLHVPVHAISNDVCASVDCVRGTCVPDSSIPILGFDCVCFSGWKKFQLGPLNIGPCVLPNCTLNLQCGSNAPPPPPPPASPPPPLNILDPCNFVFCGDGICVVNGTGHSCKCNEGSANFLNVGVLPCLKECAFGADCSGLKLGPSAPSPPPPPSNGMLPPPTPPRSPPNGSEKISRSWWNCAGLNIVLLCAIILLSAI